MRDEANYVRSKYPSIGGLVVVKDTKGNILLRKNNLVVFRGRLFAIEQIFGQPFNVPYSYGKTPTAYYAETTAGNNKGTNPNDIVDLVDTGTDSMSSDLSRLLNRRVCLFGIGSGGVPDQAWFSPSVVIPTCTKLENPIAFCSENSDDCQSNPNFYFGEKTVSGETRYFLKRINTKDANDNFLPSWVYDKATNTIAMMTTLHVNEAYLANPPDGEIKRINELGLYMATETFNQSTNTSTFSNIELFSRITFDTESLNANKELLIEYYIFA
jgi:hypothetical protein